MGIEALDAAIDELAGMDPGALCDWASIEALHRQQARFDAIVTRATAAYDDSNDWMEARAKRCANLLAFRLHLPLPACRARLRLGRAVRAMPVTEQAWLGGVLTHDHVAVLARAHKLNAERFANDEAELVGWAREETFSAFVRRLEYWIQQWAPTQADDLDDEKAERRSFHMSQSFEGMYAMDGTGDPISGETVYGEIKRLESQLFEQDWAEAKARLGRHPLPHELGRTPAQRRYDALVEMAIRSRSTPPGSRRPEPLFSVLVGWETLKGRICELSSGTVVSPGSLVPWLDEAWLERIVFESPSKIIDVGEQRRLFTGGLRRALEVRDQECFHPTCEERAEDCQGDHIEPYELGGPTTQANGRMACGWHNRNRGHRRGPPGHPPRPHP